MDLNTELLEKYTIEIARFLKNKCNYTINYNSGGIMENLKCWKDNKNGLIQALSNVSGWDNDKLAVVREIEYKVSEKNSMQIDKIYKDIIVAITKMLIIDSENENLNIETISISDAYTIARISMLINLYNEFGLDHIRYLMPSIFTHSASLCDCYEFIEHSFRLSNDFRPIIDKDLFENSGSHLLFKRNPNEKYLDFLERAVNVYKKYIRPTSFNILYILSAINSESDGFKEQNITDTQLNCATIQGMKIAKGAKLSRVLRDIIDKAGLSNVPNADKYLAPIYDLWSLKSVKRLLVISANPMDYLTMSNGNSWTSCHSVVKDGCYSNGSLSYLNDDVSLISYLIPVENKDDADYWKIPKIVRRVVHYDNQKVLHDRCYPQNSVDSAIGEAMRVETNKVLASAFGFEKFNYKLAGRDFTDANYSYGSYIYVKKRIGAICYADWNDCSNNPIFETVMKFEDIKSPMLVGKKPLYLTSGEESDRSRISYQTGKMKIYEPLRNHELFADKEGLFTCCVTGNQIDRNVAIKLADGSYCHKDYATYCSLCGKYHLKEKFTQVELVNDWGTISKYNVCNTCLNDPEKISICDKCGRYTLCWDTHSDIKLCSSCLEDYNSSPYSILDDIYAIHNSLEILENPTNTNQNNNTYQSVL